MKVVISGSSGLIGSALVASLTADGHDVVALVRRTPTAAGQVRWDPASGASGVTPELRSALDGARAVVNLAGAGVAEQRWDDAWKREILDSRVAATTCLATAITDVKDKPAVFVSGSASGYYGDTGSVAVDESAHARPDVPGARLRVVGARRRARARGRGARGAPAHRHRGRSRRRRLRPLAPDLQARCGRPAGNGKQWWSLISLTDEVRGIRHAIDAESLVGPANFAAPEQTTNGDLAKALGRALSRPSLVPAPLFGLKSCSGSSPRSSSSTSGWLRTP